MNVECIINVVSYFTKNRPLVVKPFSHMLENKKACFSSIEMLQNCCDRRKWCLFRWGARQGGEGVWHAGFKGKVRPKGQQALEVSLELILQFSNRIDWQSRRMAWDAPNALSLLGKIFLSTSYISREANFRTDSYTKSGDSSGCRNGRRNDVECFVQWMLKRFRLLTAGKLGNYSTFLVHPLHASIGIFAGKHIGDWCVSAITEELLCMNTRTAVRKQKWNMKQNL